MAISPPEWMVIAAILLILFIWGPKKLPELARSIGLAKKEFEKVAKEATGVTTTPAEPSTDPLLVAAMSLGITTEGKTKEQIAKEIAEKTPK